MPALTEVQKNCIMVFNANSFTQARRRNWLIWGAKTMVCPTCEQGVGMACLNMADKKQKGVLFARETRWPHHDRVDWEKIYEGLTQRGFVSGEG